jgi:hypothetical protein
VSVPTDGPGLLSCLLLPRPLVSSPRDQLLQGVEGAPFSGDVGRATTEYRLGGTTAVEITVRPTRGRGVYRESAECGPLVVLVDRSCLNMC